MHQAPITKHQALIPLSGWESRHLLYTWLAAAMAMLSAFWESGPNWIATAGGYILAAGIALLAAKTLRIAIYDVLAQFQYREKFALFLFHLGGMGVPVMFGYRGWHYAFGVLLVMLCFQAVHALGMGRIHAVTIVLGILPLLAPPLPPFALTTGWMLFLATAMRAEHVRFRVARFGEHQGVPAGAALRETLAAVWLPWAAGVGIWGLWVLAFGSNPRRLVFEKGITRGGPVSVVGAVSMSETIWSGVILIGMIIGALLALHWFDKHLRGKRKATVQPIIESMDVTDSFAPLEEPPAPADDEAEPRDARGRILARFRGFARALAVLGWARAEGETPDEYLARLRRELLDDAEILSPIRREFYRACYSHEQISDEQAREFLRNVDAIEPILRDEIGQRE